MASSHTAKPVTDDAVNRPREDCLAGELDSPSFSEPAKNAQAFIDRFGHRHSEAILKNWSPAAIRAMGIRPVVK
jgi:hypothetical protein